MPKNNKYPQKTILKTTDKTTTDNNDLIEEEYRLTENFEEKIELRLLTKKEDNLKDQDLEKTTFVADKEVRKGFNYRIVKYFLDNFKITILTLLLLLLVGGIATLNLKTTGFPSPNIGIVVITSTYPGASSDTVLKDVTKPTESIVKSLEGIENYSSTSNNSFSNVVLTLKADTNYETIQNKVSSQINSLSLPNNVTTTVSSPSIGGADFIFSMYDQDPSRLFNAYQEVKTLIESDNNIKTIKQINELNQEVVITLDRQQLAQKGLDINAIQTSIKSLGEGFPVTSNLNLSEQKTALVVNYSNKKDYLSLEELIIPSKSGFLKLKDIAKISINYNNKDDKVSIIGIREEDKIYTGPALTFSVNLNKGADSEVFLKNFKTEIEKAKLTIFNQKKDNKVVIVNNFSVTKNNKEQVDEVVSGLIGGELAISNKTLAKVGYLLGGIQLVFLVMMAFVSWRTAVIAAISIPLSLIFTNIYLYFTGNSLNTLVLFSLVLVIGLVVDPALVVLESLQRKIDAGIKGKKAALLAVTDVGGGLFMASLTNIIVFAPFGTISGILGQIFGYIPLTIVPATIGSYLVPLIFLTWLSNKFLKPSRKAQHLIAKNLSPEEIERDLHKNEVNNLWFLAKKVMSLNKIILHSPWFVRFGIIALTLGLSITVTFVYFGNGLIKQVQFSSPVNGNNLSLNIAHKSNLLEQDKNRITQDIVNKIMEYPEVLAIHPFENTYRIELKNAVDREGTSTELASKISKDIVRVYGGQVFDLGVKVLGNGAPASDYQVQIAIASDDQTKLKNTALDIASTVKKLCEDSSKKITIEDNCNATKVAIARIDDGYTGKENPVEYITFNRAKLLENNLILPSQGSAYTPSLIYVTTNIKSLFAIDDRKSQNTINIDGREVPVVLESSTPKPKNIQELENSSLISLSGKLVVLKEVATITKQSPPLSIVRIKGQTLGNVKIGLEAPKNDQANAGKISNAIVEYYQDETRINTLGLKKGDIKIYSEGGVSSFLKSFQELIVALIFAIIASYIVLAIFFKSILQPIAILYTIPLTFFGILPALAHIGSGQFGFLEIIGLIILVGIVENVAIFLIDSANNLMVTDGLDDRTAIIIASGLRFRPVILTKLTAIASLAPLAFLSETYRQISLVIIFGLLASGFLSLITTPILFIFFRRLSEYSKSILFKVLSKNKKHND